MEYTEASNKDIASIQENHERLYHHSNKYFVVSDHNGLLEELLGHIHLDKYNPDRRHTKSSPEF